MSKYENLNEVRYFKLGMKIETSNLISNFDLEKLPPQRKRVNHIFLGYIYNAEAAW